MSILTSGLDDNDHNSEIGNPGTVQSAFHALSDLTLRSPARKLSLTPRFTDEKNE